MPSEGSLRGSSIGFMVRKLAFKCLLYYLLKLIDFDRITSPQWTTIHFNGYTIKIEKISCYFLGACSMPGTAFLALYIC